MNAIPHEQLLDSLFDGVYYVDRDRRITFWNTAAERITGFSREEVLGVSCAEGILRHIDGTGRNLCEDSCPLQACLEDGEHREAEVYLHHRDGHRVPVMVRAAPLHDETGAIVGAVEVFNDISHRKQVMRELQHARREAYIDGLTRVGNRRYADLILDARFRERREYGIDFGVLVVDVDHFKGVNDTYGHEVGDKVLRMIAKTMLGACRDLDVVSRWGGEEFLVVIPNTDRAGLMEVGERLRAFVENSWFVHDGQEIRVTVSVGGALVRPGDDPAAIVRRADSRMYVCKDCGRNRTDVE